MILNEVLTRQNIISKIELKEGNKELPKELKVKIMRIRLAYNKVKKAFDEDVKEFVEQIATDEYKELAQKPSRTEEEEKKYNELNTQINSDYIEFVNQKGFEEVKETFDDKLTENEYAEILDVNSGNDVEINGVKIKAGDLMEILYELFVA
jgi:capsular polysaccharide biosynthesis protein